LKGWQNIADDPCECLVEDMARAKILSAY